MMLFEGIPWPLVIPIAIVAMIYAIMNSKKVEKEFQREINRIKNEKEA